jgi:hypothetical protein
LILVDGGPLVGVVNVDDQYHSRCVAALKTFREPLARVWPAVTEGMYFLVRVAEREGIRKIFTVGRGDFSVYRLHGRIRPTLIP